MISPIKIFNEMQPIHQTNETIGYEGGKPVIKEPQRSLEKTPAFSSKIDDLTEPEELCAWGTLSSFYGLGLLGFSTVNWLIFLLLGSVLRYRAERELVPKDALSIRHKIAEYSFLCPIVGHVHRIYTIGANSIKKLGDCFRYCRSEPTKALKNGLVHVINLAGIQIDVSSMIWYATSLGSLMKSSARDLAKFSQSPRMNSFAHDAAKFSQFSPFEKLSCLKLDPTQHVDAEIMMGIDSNCQTEGVCDKICAEVGRMFRKLSLVVHPDKKGPQLTPIFHRLVTARDTLFSFYKC